MQWSWQDMFPFYVSINSIELYSELEHHSQIGLKLVIEQAKMCLVN